jgi:hypothetical protein
MSSGHRGKQQLGNATYVMEKRSTAELRRLGIKPQPVAMIDYILISQRFRSSAEGDRVCWGPTMLRHGLGKYDHGMVEITFRMSLKRSAVAVKKNMEEGLHRARRPGDEGQARSDCARGLEGRGPGWRGRRGSGVATGRRRCHQLGADAGPGINAASGATADRQVSGGAWAG